MGAYEFKTVRLNATSDGDNTIVAGVTNKQIRVTGFFLVGAAAGTLTIQDSLGTPEVQFAFPIAAAGDGAIFAGSLDGPAFTLDQGVGLEINNSAGLDTTGFVTYVEI